MVCKTIWPNLRRDFGSSGELLENASRRTGSCSMHGWLKSGRKLLRFWAVNGSNFLAETRTGMLQDVASYNMLYSNMLRHMYMLHAIIFRWRIKNLQKYNPANICEPYLCGLKTCHFSPSFRVRFASRSDSWCTATAANTCWSWRSPELPPRLVDWRHRNVRKPNSQPRLRLVFQATSWKQPTSCLRIRAKLKRIHQRWIPASL